MKLPAHMIVRRDVDAFVQSSAIKTTLFHVSSSPKGYLSLLTRGPDLSTTRTAGDPAFWMSQRPWLTRGPLGVEVAVRATRPQVGKQAADQVESVERLLGRRGVTADGDDAIGYFAGGHDVRIKGGQAGSNLTVIAYPGADVRVVLGARTLAAPAAGVALLAGGGLALHRR